MTTNLDLYYAWMIRTPRGFMRVAALRPGDCIVMASGRLMFVMVNSTKLQRAVIRFADGKEIASTYETISRDSTFVGHGRRRRWHARLPRWLQRHFCPFSRP